MRFTLDNRSGYSTASLQRFLARGFRHWFGSREQGVVHVVVMSSPIRSRGCATVGGRRMVLSIASPSHYSLRRLARLFDHEAAHVKGLEHEDMPEDVLYSTGPIPRWAREIRLTYEHRAPDQMALLAAHHKRNQKRKRR